MSLIARDLFILMDSAITWIYFRNSQPPISLTAAASLFRDTETELDFFIKYLSGVI